MIKFKNLYLKYDALNNPTLKNISFEINKGEKVLIVGPSGSGKSTITKMINGLIPNSDLTSIEGEATVDDMPLQSTSIFKLSEKVGTILQDQDAQFVGLTAAEDIAFYLENSNVEVDEMHKIIDKVLEKLQIENLKNDKPRDLSGGQKQKVSLAGILVNDVDYLLLDEPLANLDPVSADEIMLLLDKLNKDFNKTIIIVEHRLESVFAIDFDRVLVINEGELVANCTPTELLTSDILTKIGIRKPLYIEALDNIGYDYSNIDNILDYSQYDLSSLVLNNNCNVVNKNTNKILLEVDNLNFSYNKHKTVIKDVNFKLYEGEVLALLGRNGTGKTTLSNILLGIIKGYNGDITLKGESIDKLSIFERGNKISYVMQNPNYIITEVKVCDEVAFKLRNKSLSEDEINDRVDEILNVCNLSKYKQWPISMLSYGQRRRVTIASALIEKPEVIVLDEPTAGQDYDTFRSIMTLVRKLSNELKIGIIIITHNMQLAYEYCDFTIVLGDGTIQFKGSMDELYNRKDILKESSLKETTIQSFAHYHNINANKFGNLLFGGDEDGNR